MGKTKEIKMNISKSSRLWKNFYGGDNIQIANSSNNMTTNISLSNTNKNKNISNQPKNANWNQKNFQETLKSFVLENMKDQPYEFYDNYLTDENRAFFQKPIGLHDPLGENVNPFTLQPYELIHSGTKDLKGGPLVGKSINKSYRNLSYIWTNQIVYKKFLNTLISNIRENQVTLLISGTGTGKTVITPRAAMEAFNYQKKVIVTIPKKTICQSAAEFAAECSGVKIGEEIGYYFAGANQTSEKTKLTYCTTGSLISKITGDDPYLNDYDCVIIDEAHERSVQTDLLLFYIKKALTVRKDLKLVIMSATISKEKFLGYFPNGNSKNNSVNNLSKAKFKTKEVDVGSEKLFTVESFWESQPIPDMEWKKKAAEKVVEILTTTQTGDIMVFIASAPDGNFICNEIKNKIKGHNVNPICVVLHGSSSKEDKEFAIGDTSLNQHPEYNASRPTRKLVMATNVAESSITIDSIVYVIESGYHYEQAYFPEESARSLMLERISKASVRQREGRAGRTQNGYCYHLYTEKEFEGFHDYPIPDIQKTDLTDFVLDMLKLPYIQNVDDIQSKILNYLIDPPSEAFVQNAIHNLYALQCIDKDTKEGKVTELGIALSKFRGIPLHFAKAILTSYYLNCKYDLMEIYCIYVALDGKIKDLFEEPRKRKNIDEYAYQEMMRDFEKKKKKYYSKYGDFFTVYDAYHDFKNFMGKPMNNRKQNIVMNVQNEMIVNNNQMEGGMNQMNLFGTKTKAEATEWLRERALSPRLFLGKGKGKLGNIKRDMQKLNFTLMSIVHPPELKKKYFNELKKNNTNVSMKNIEKEIQMNHQNNNQGIEMETTIFENKVPKHAKEEMEMEMMMMGGFSKNKKPYEVNYFPTLQPSQDKYENMSLSLCMGLIINMAKLVNQNKALYRTAFPLKKIDCRFDRDTSLIAKTHPSLVYYGELFKLRKDQPILKLNFVNRIPSSVVSQLESFYPDLLTEYMKKEKNTHSYDDSKSKGKKRYSKKMKRRRY
jgi:HrpA-like RNA helicase